MLGVSVKIPGTAGIVEAKKARLAAAVEHQFNIVTAAPRKAPPGERGRFGQAAANREAGITIRDYLACAGGGARPVLRRWNLRG